VLGGGAVGGGAGFAAPDTALGSACTTTILLPVGADKYFWPVKEPNVALSCANRPFGFAALSGGVALWASSSESSTFVADGSDSLRALRSTVASNLLNGDGSLGGA